MRLLSCKNIIQTSVRYSRSSVVQYRRRKSLLKEYQIEKTTSEIENKENIYEELEKPISNIVPVNSQKTSITVDILDEESYSEISDWRRGKLLKRARRVLPLPFSLTTDKKLKHVWKQKYISSLEKLGIKVQKTQEELELESIPEIVKILAKDNPEILKKMNLYDDFIKIQQNIEKRTKKTETNDSLDSIDSGEKVPYFPYQKTLETISSDDNPHEALASNENMNKNLPHYRDEVDNKLLDQEYENFLKHHELLQYLATNLQKVHHKEYLPEVKGWSDQDWLRNYGKPDPGIAPTNIPCSGCGAHLHCTSTNIPGFMPSEKFKLYSTEELRTQFCQRCDFLKRYNVALSVTATEDDYPKLISEIKNKDSLVVILVDLLDFPCSVWPGIINLIGQNHQLYLVGNKVDLMPKDDDRYLERIKHSMKVSLRDAGIDKNCKVRDVSLISAKTGHGVEDLVTKLLRDVKSGQDIYLIGCTNSGKSTLFNVLMQTDLCALRENDIISRATTSIWPGTTLNLLKFPVKKLTAWELKMRTNRLNIFEKNDISERKLKWTMHRQSVDSMPYATLQSRITTTFRKNLPFELSEDHPLRKSSDATPFNPDLKQFKDCSFILDTPGALYKDQILNLLTTEELLRTIPREIITPRTYTLEPYQTLFLAGLGRLDLVHSRQKVWLTVFASKYLPINIVYTEKAKNFYETYCGTDILSVPIGDFERLEKWPNLMPKEFTIKGQGWEKSSADIVLSNAGWVSVTTDPDTECVIRAFTPQGRGIFLRDPPILPFAVNLKGRKIPGTPCFQNKLYTVDQLVKGSYPKKFERHDARIHSNEGENFISDERIRKAKQFIEE